VLLPGTLSVGASGALMGVLGASAAHALAGWARPAPGADAAGARGQGLLAVVVNVAVVLAFSFSPTIDWTAHVFGLLGGLLLGAAVLGPEDAVGGGGPAAAGAGGGGGGGPAGGAQEWRPPSPRAAVAAPTGVFSRSGAGLLAEPPDAAPWATARRTACGCARPGGPCGAPAGARAAGAAAAFVGLAALFAALLWGPAPPAARPPRALLDVCGGLRAAGYDVACGGWP